MAVETQVYNVQAYDLRELMKLANEVGGAILVRNVGGLILSADVSPEDLLADNLTEAIPGVLMEGVTMYRDGHENDNVELTVWAGGSMHLVTVDADSEAEVRIAINLGDASGGKLPELEVCGRCNRHVVTTPHVGC